MGKPMQPIQTPSIEIKLPPPNGPDPWYRCAYYSGMINDWYAKTESHRLSIPGELPQEKKFYVDIAVLQAKRELGVDSATPVTLEEWGEMAAPGYNGMVEIQAAGRRVSVSFEHDTLDEPAVRFEKPKDGRRVIFSVCEQNRGNDWERFVKDVSGLDKNTFTLCVSSWPGNPVDHEATMKQHGVNGHVIKLTGEFSRAAGMDACAKDPSYQDDDIIFATDVDVYTPQDVITAVRRYVSLGHRAYFPVGPNRALHQTGLGAFAIGDYKRVGGYDTAKYGNRYGYEDTDLFYRLRLARVMPVRFFHDELKHIDHAPMQGWSGVNTPHGEFHHCKGFGYIGEEDHLLAAGQAMWNRPLNQLRGA